LSKIYTIVSANTHWVYNFLLTSKVDDEEIFRKNQGVRVIQIRSLQLAND